MPLRQFSIHSRPKEKKAKNCEKVVDKSTSAKPTNKPNAHIIKGYKSRPKSPRSGQKPPIRKPIRHKKNRTKIRQKREQNPPPKIAKNRPKKQKKNAPKTTTKRAVSERKSLSFNDTKTYSFLNEKRRISGSASRQNFQS